MSVLILACTEMNILLEMTAEPTVGVSCVDKVELTPNEVPHRSRNGLYGSRLSGVSDGGEKKVPKNHVVMC